MAEYIERKTLVERLTRNLNACNPGKFYEMCYQDAINTVTAFPAADVAPVRHGQWEECDYVEPCIHGFGTIRHKNAGLKCTNCVHVFKKNILWKDNYCPNCGAKMDGGADHGRIV